jgi:LPS-assembly lipoprotein
MSSSEAQTFATGRPQRLARPLVLAALCSLLGACGFHLQGAVRMPENLRTVYIATKDELTPFATELRDALEDNGLEIAPRSKEADAVVRVSADRYGRRVLSVSARNTPAEYEVYYSIDYSVDRAGSEVVPSQHLELTRSFTFDESLLLAKEREEEIIREAMARDLASLVLRRIGSL